MSEFDICVFCLDGYDLYILDGKERSPLLLYFDDLQEAIDIADHWRNWAEGMNV